MKFTLCLVLEVTQFVPQNLPGVGLLYHLDKLCDCISLVSLSACRDKVA